MSTLPLTFDELRATTTAPVGATTTATAGATTMWQQGQQLSTI